MNKMWRLLWLALFIPLYLASTCSEEDDEEQIAAEVTPPPGGCDENTAPVLTEGEWWVDGAATGAAATFAEGEAAQVYLGVRDDDCNMAGGTIAYLVDDEEIPQEIKIPSDLGCEAAADEQLVGFELFAFGVGGHRLSIRVTDRCGAESQALELTFTLTEYEPPVADDDAADDDATDDDDATATRLAGEIRYFGEPGDVTGRPVLLYLFAQWLPAGTLPAAALTVEVPAAGFPFAYAWDVGDTEAAPGDYYLFAFLDVQDDDGLFNAGLDPAHAPYATTAVLAGQTTTAHITLVPPGE